MDHAARVLLSYAAERDAQRVGRSVRPEIGDIDGDRTRASLDREGATLVVTVEAADPVALRAGINTWLSLVEVAERAGGVSTSHRAG